MTLAPAAYARLCAGIALVATAWCLLAALTPLLERHGHPEAALAGRLLFAPLCHQLPERAFRIDGSPMPLCARCTGIHAGFAAGCWGLALAGLAGWRRQPRGARLLAFAAAPCLLQWIAQQLDPTTQAGGSLARAFTGLLPGAILAAYLLPATARWMEERIENRARPIRARRANEAEG